MPGRNVRTFDYVIVGAGSAGCVLASRLSEDGRHSVLLLEAGGSDRRLHLRVPIGYGLTFFDPRVNWMYYTEPDAGTGGRRSYWPRGRVLGGSSTINAMLYVRGQPRDYDHWLHLGNPGWGWRDVLPVFRSMEDFSGGDDALHGTGGPVAVTDISRQAHPLCEAFLEAGQQAGIPRNRDFNGASQEGVGHYAITMRNGLRVSSASAYLRPAMKRPNLEVVTGALASRLLLEDRRAAGVEYLRRGTRHAVSARREVVVCAGAVGSPLILQRSGIGPGDVLQELGIGVVADVRAVGRNLQDHLCIDYLYRSRMPSLNEEFRLLHRRMRAAWQYLASRRGPLSLSVNQAGGFCRSRPGLDTPDMQLYFSPLSYTRTPPGRRPLMSPDPFPGFLLGASPCRLQSRGCLQIRSTDPEAAPEIHPRYLDADEDVLDMLRASRLLRRLADTRALREVIDEELLPGPGVTADEALVEDVRARCTTVFHPVGTCAMGPDPRCSVVDPRLRVHGFEGLRIADASIFPTITSGNTNAPAMMVGEKAAAMVREDAGKSR